MPLCRSRLLSKTLSMQLKSALLTTAVLVLAGAAFGQTVPQPGPLTQAISVDMYPKMPVGERQAYVAGVLDTDRVLFPQSKAQCAACFNGTTIAQLTDVVDRSLPSLEPVLRTTMPIAVHNALINDCDRRGFKG